MADPLALTALGITVCQGFTSAIGPWKDFNDDLAIATTKFTSLEKTLQVLQDILRRQSPNNSQAALVTSRIQACHCGLQRLDGELKKLRGHQAPVGPGRRAMKDLQHAGYPITKTSLKKIRSLVAALQDELALVLQIYQLYMVECP